MVIKKKKQIRSKKAKRKICFVLTSKIHYSRSKLILRELSRMKDIELQIVVAGSAILERYGDVEALIKKDGFPVTARITMVLEGGSTVAMAKTTGLGLSEFSTVFENLNPDVVVVRGDRYEVMAPVVAAAYMNKTIAHIEGGDVTGSIDESVRHAITKLAHIHFATNDVSRRRILRMGEWPQYVFNVGAPDVEIAANNNVSVSNEDVSHLGVGAHVDIAKPFIIVMQHPVTSEMSGNQSHMEETLKAIHALKMPTILFWPNVDAGVDEVSKAIRTFKENTDIDDYIRFLKYIEPNKFLALLKRAASLIGNSSSGIKEASYLGVPVVNIGSRQHGRLRAKNVIDVPHDAAAIRKAIEKQLAHGRHTSSKIYFKKDSSKTIARILKDIRLYTQKQFFDRE
jgi:UDP-hydrolysing UDP-N-acetyl-D-glucosamine 2-epimerase